LPNGTNSKEGIQAEAVLQHLRQWRGGQCPQCKGVLCAHEALMSLVMGFKDAPRCCSCLADSLQQSREEFRDALFLYITHRPCYSEGWEWASREEGFEAPSVPACLWSLSESNDRKDSGPGLSPDSYGFPDPAANPAAEWDAGNMGCGELLLQLRIRLQGLQPGQVLKVIAQDPGAREDMPAWCRLTHHLLIRENHPEYWIQRKEN